MNWSSPLYRFYEHRLIGKLPQDRMPAHIGVILDGHRRFAKQEGQADLLDTYRQGVAKLEEFLEWCAQLQIPAITAWVLSTENLDRTPADLAPLFVVLEELLRAMPALAKRLGFSLQVIGSIDLLPASLALAAKEAERDSQFGGWQFNLALGYGGRQEIVDACRSLVSTSRRSPSISTQALSRIRTSLSEQVERQGSRVSSSGRLHTRNSYLSTPIGLHFAGLTFSGHFGTLCTGTGDLEDSANQP